MKLGQLGREGDALAKKVNDDIASFIPKIEMYLESGQLKPMQYEVVEGNGFVAVLKGLEIFSTRQSDGKKVVVNIEAE